MATALQLKLLLLLDQGGKVRQRPLSSDNEDATTAIVIVEASKVDGQSAESERDKSSATGGHSGGEYIQCVLVFVW